MYIKKEIKHPLFVNKEKMKTKTKPKKIGHSGVSVNWQTIFRYMVSHYPLPDRAWSVLIFASYVYLSTVFQLEMLDIVRD